MMKGMDELEYMLAKEGKMPQEDTRAKLLRIIKDIAAGIYSDEIIELTRQEHDPVIREVAEAVGMMMVRIEARELAMEQLHDKIREDALRTVTAIARALAARDAYTEGHGDRVGAYAARVARRMGLGDEEAERLRIAGVLHDIGKIAFSDRLFGNDDIHLDAQMLHEIRQHPGWGHKILGDLEHLGPVRDYILWHHERLDGSGYPDGLTEEGIPLPVRILSAVDCFDAMTTDRSYQTARSSQEALGIMRSLVGTALDGAVVEALASEVADSGLESSTGTDLRT